MACSSSTPGVMTALPGTEEFIVGVAMLQNGCRAWLLHACQIALEVCWMQAYSVRGTRTRLLSNRIKLL